MDTSDFRLTRVSQGVKTFKPGLCWKWDMQGNRKFIVPINSSQCNDAGFFPRRHLSEAWGKKIGGRALIRRKVVEGRRESLGRAAWPQAHPSNSQLHPSSIRATFLLSFHLQLAMSSSSICYYQLLLSPRRVPSFPSATRHLPTLLSSLNTPTLQSLIYNHWQRERHKQLTASE